MSEEINNNNEDYFDEIEGEEDEILDIPENQRQIHFNTPTKQVKHLFTDYSRGDLDARPAFQRGYVWDLKKASRLVESVLLGVPIPIVYTAELKDGTEIVIDGQQRLLSLFAYLKGEFPKNKKKFKLRGCEVIKDINGKGFQDLDKPSQRAIENYAIPFITITKESDQDVKFMIFERLNTGSVKLTDQELRNCIYRGNLNELLKELSENKDYEIILSSSRLKERMIDQELILRFFSFHEYTYLKYKAPMKQFLNKFAEKHKNLKEKELQKYKNLFKKSASCFV